MAAAIIDTSLFIRSRDSGVRRMPGLHDWDTIVYEYWMLNDVKVSSLINGRQVEVNGSDSEIAILKRR